MVRASRGRCVINYNLNGGIATRPPLNVTPPVSSSIGIFPGDAITLSSYGVLRGAEILSLKAGPNGPMSG
jgi:hypothetical protein